VGGALAHQSGTAPAPHQQQQPAHVRVAAINCHPWCPNAKIVLSFNTTMLAMKEGDEKKKHDARRCMLHEFFRCAAQWSSKVVSCLAIEQAFNSRAGIG